MIRPVAGLLAGNALLVVLGAGFLLASGTWSRTTPLARPGVALFAGLAGFMALVPPLLYAGVSPSPAVVAALATAVLAFGLLRERRRDRGRRDSGGGGVVVASFAAVPLLMLAARAVYKPLWGGDTMLDWTLKAKLLYGSGGALTGALDERFFESDAYSYAHLEYPLGLPALEAFSFHMMGSADTRVLHLQFVVILAAFIATQWALLRPRLDPVLLGAGLVALLFMPAVWRLLLTGYADIPIALFWVAAALSLGLWVAGDGPDRLVLSALFAAAALGTKQEGILFDGILFAAAAAALVVARDRRRLRELAAGAGAVALTAVPWQAFSASRGLANPAFEPSPDRLAARAGDVPQIVSTFSRSALESSWAYVLPLGVVAAAVLLVRGRDWPLAIAYLGTMLALFGALTLVYLTFDPDRSLTRLLTQSAGRVVATPMLVSAALLPLLLARALAAAPGERPGREARRPALRRGHAAASGSAVLAVCLVRPPRRKRRP